MTTDITELAQSLKASAVRAQDAIEEYASQRISSTELRLEIEEFENLTHKPANILALVEALEKAQRANAAQDDHINQQQDRIEQLERRNAEIGKYAGSLETSHKKLRESMAAIHNTVRLDGVNTRLSTILSASKCAYDESATVSELESRTVTVKPDDADEVREEGNQFLVVRHPGKVPVIKHPVGQLEDYLLQILKADPLATIDIVTHRYYGVGGQFVEDADEYLHEMGIKWEAE